MSSATTMQQAKTEVPQTAQRSSQRNSEHAFNDLRPQTTVQRQLQDTASHSSQSRQFNAFQQMAQNSTRSTQLKSMSEMTNAPALQRVKEKEALQAKMPISPVQREVAASAEKVPAPNNTGLPDNLKSGIESLSGMSMDHVKVHYNSAQPAQLNAHAYAQGSDIHVAPGQEQHLPHEAWHVVQQAQGRVRPTMQMKTGVAVNADAGLESEASVMGERALGQGALQRRQEGDVTMSDPVQRSQHSIVQRAVRKEGDLDYGSANDRAEGMENARLTGQDKRGTMMSTIDLLNREAGITTLMEKFQFHELIRYISEFNKAIGDVDKDKTIADVDKEKMKHVYAWRLYLKENIEKIDLKKQFMSLTAPKPVDATKDRLNKNRQKGQNGQKGVAPEKVSIYNWYLTKTMPSDADELVRLKHWVWNAFFRRTSKLGIDFTASRGKAIHFNISDGMYTRGIGQRDKNPLEPETEHKKLSITGSELRHLRKLQDRGLAPKTHFEDNQGGVKDVDSPFRRLDLLSPAAKVKLLQRPEWKQHAVNFETRLGGYAANLPAARSAVQAGLTKMDQVFAKHNNEPKEEEQIAKYREVFGKTKPTSSGQVGTDPATVASVVTGTHILGEDPINLREQMTAYYNAAFWSRGTTIKKILTNLIKSQGDESLLGIGGTEIDEICDLMKPQLKATKEVLTATSNLPNEQRLIKLQTDLELDLSEATELLQKIEEVGSQEKEIEKLPQGEQKEATKELKRKFTQIAVDYTKFNILVTSIDNDASRNARQERPKEEQDAVRKSAKDYADMGVPLSNREKASIGGVQDNLAKLPWVDGIVYYRIDESQGWGKEMKETGFPTVAGNSGTAARMLKVYQWLGGTEPLNFRMALMGWMLPVRDHSLYEILDGAKSVNVTGAGEDLTNPLTMYALIQPLDEATLKANVAVDGLFPEEHVLKTVDMAVYKDLIQTPV